jgi:hypothetical protein
MPIALSRRAVLAISLCLTMTTARRLAAQAADSLSTAAMPAAAARSQADAESRPARVALTFKPISTLGFGLEAGRLITNRLGFRAGVNGGLPLNTTQDEDDIRVSLNARVLSFDALVDLYPGARHSFHFTGGVVANRTRFKGDATPRGDNSFELNDREYPASEVGTLHVDVEYPKTSPYAGIGWGKPSGTRRVGVQIDLGAVLAKPKLGLSATGAATNPQLAADVEAQRRDTQKRVNRILPVYPVIAAGASYRF